MLTQKTKSTNRRYYNKWLYKVSLAMEGSTLLRSESIKDLRDKLSKPEVQEHTYWSSWNKAYANRYAIIDLCDFLLRYTKEVYALRVEGFRLDVYTNDVNFYQTLSLRCESRVLQRFEPNANNIKALQDSKNIITVKKLPKDKYRYRVYLLPHKMAKDLASKQKYLNWLKSQQPKVTCTPAIEKWFYCTDWNWDRRYILVEDETMLLMLKLRSPEVMGRVYNFVICDK
jgi:hypothetical protein